VHPVARGALIGGAAGAVLSLARRRDLERGGRFGRLVKSVAGGAAAGAGVALVLDRGLRARAVELVAEHGPEVVEAVAGFAEEALEAARPRLHELADLARDRAEHLLATA
jgi:hypothetical protein